jgi:hypothetical protein
MSLAAETLQALADARRKAREREVCSDIRTAVLGVLKPYGGSDLAIATRALHDVGAEQFGAVHGPVRLATRSSAVAGKAWGDVVHLDTRREADRAFLSTAEGAFGAVQDGGRR